MYFSYISSFIKTSFHRQASYVHVILPELIPCRINVSACSCLIKKKLKIGEKFWLIILTLFWVCGTNMTSWPIYFLLLWFIMVDRHYSWTGHDISQFKFSWSVEALTLHAQCLSWYDRQSSSTKIWYTGSNSEISTRVSSPISIKIHGTSLLQPIPKRV